MIIKRIIIILTEESTRCRTVIYDPAQSQIEGLAFVLAMFVVNNIGFIYSLLP